MMKQLMKLLAVALIIFLASGLSHAAMVNIIIKPKSPYQFNVDAIWDFDVINLSGKKLSAKIINTVFDKKNKIIYKESSDNVSIVDGFQSFSKTNITAIRKELTDPGYANIISQNHTLKAGAYNHCIELLINTGNEVIGESSCEPFEVSVLSPPQLIYPEHKSDVSENFPVFLWTPLILPYQSTITYNFKLVQILQNQTLIDAILKNSPICLKTGLQNNMYPYPPDAFPLQDNNAYAWQVEVVDENNMIALTEVWEFKKGKDTIEAKYMAPAISYLDLDVYDVNEQYYAKGVLKIKFVPRKEKGTLTYKIFDKEKLLVNSNNKINYQSNDQLYEIPVMNHIEILKEGNYTVVLDSDDGRSYLIKIKYIEPQVK